VQGLVFKAHPLYIHICLLIVKFLLIFAHNPQDLDDIFDKKNLISSLKKQGVTLYDINPITLNPEQA
jgi:hypothetical protein